MAPRKMIGKYKSSKDLKNNECNTSAPIKPNYDENQINKEESVQLEGTNLCAVIEDTIYTVEKVLKRRKIGNKVCYYIKWRGYSNRQNTWEPAENVEQLDLVKLYEDNLKNSQTEKLPADRKNLKRSYSDAVGTLWEVEEVSKKRVKKGGVEYFIKWKDLHEDYNTWEPRKMLLQSEVVKAYEKKEKSKLKEKERSLLKLNLQFKKLGQLEENQECMKNAKKLVPIPKLVEDSNTRQYYDCVTLRPITTDKSVKNSNTWLQTARQRKINSEIELDDGQKEFATMWNEFLLDNRTTFRGNCHMKPALDYFITKYAKKIADKKLKACYISHISIMKDLGLLNTAEAMEYVIMLNGMA